MNPMSSSSPSIKDVMSATVISVHPETPLLDAHELLAKHKFDGMPVVDGANKILGILTEYDFIVKGSSMHLPTFQKIIMQLSVYQKDRTVFQKEVEELKHLTVKDIMNNEPLTLPDSASFEDAVIAFRDHHRVNPIPVLDKAQHVVGVVSRYDVLKLFTTLRAE